LRNEIVKGLLNHENVEENTSERRRQCEFLLFEEDRMIQWDWKRVL
jgi:hypothetical protein